MLTTRQWKIVALIAEGMTNREIAAELGLATLYVKQLMSPIYDATGMSNRVELTNWFNEHKETHETNTADISAGLCC